MLEKILEWLDLKEGDRIITAGEHALLTAAFIAGSEKTKGVIIKAHAVVSTETEEEAMAIAEKEGVQEQVKQGLAIISYETGGIDTVKPLKKYEMLVSINLPLEKLEPAGRIAENALLLFPHEKGGMIETTAGLFKKKQITSLKKVIEKSFAIIDYDLVGKHLFFKTRPKKFRKTEYQLLTCEKASEVLIKKLQGIIRFATGGSVFAITSDDKEFLYYIKVEDAMGKPFEYYFVFPNGKCKKTVGNKRIRSKIFTIIMLPNVKSIVKELGEKEVVITSKERVLQLFGERYAY